MGIESYAAQYLDQLRAVLSSISLDQLSRLAGILCRARDENRRIYIFGNGGSAVTASHFAVDLGKGTAAPGRPRFQAVSLAENVALLTALGNDTSYERIFVEQLRDTVRAGDVVIGISASGNSENVLEAVRYARQQGAVTVALTGFGGGALARLVDEALVVEQRNYGLAEDAHLALIHILTQYLKNELAGCPDDPVRF